ncbi:MAG: isoaspartyl peptidase/L-asparaginase [Chitinophagaceae bacterium]|nr:isoaspartyl peptidase/L-asparaginase [Chitinophagaceae bacterium]
MTYSLTLHGGAGTILKSSMTPELEASYRLGLEEALDAGYRVLTGGGTALDAVLAATCSLEDNIRFNAGRGSVFAKDGSQEMDASIMEGKSMMAGAVSAVKNIRNPVELAYQVMMKSPHVMLIGKGANDFAALHGIPLEHDEYFFSQFRYDQWKQMQNSDDVALDHNVALTEQKKGTVGAAACDVHGNIAAATSTGGMTNKQWGRVGDSSIIGAGTYANNKTCAISCTGHGEMFIRAVAAYDVSCLMEYKGYSLQKAMDIVVNEKLMAIDGEGGMVGVDAMGNTAMIFNSEGMYRAMQSSNGEREIAIYK